jgi:hypothetical protein
MLARAIIGVDPFGMTRCALLFSVTGTVVTGSLPDHRQIGEPHARVRIDTRSGHIRPVDEREFTLRDRRCVTYETSAIRSTRPSFGSTYTSRASGLQAGGRAPSISASRCPVWSGEWLQPAVNGPSSVSLELVVKGNGAIEPTLQQR